MTPLGVSTPVSEMGGCTVGLDDSGELLVDKEIELSERGVKATIYEHLVERLVRLAWRLLTRAEDLAVQASPQRHVDGLHVTV